MLAMRPYLAHMAPSVTGAAAVRRISSMGLRQASTVKLREKTSIARQSVKEQQQWQRSYSSEGAQQKQHQQQQKTGSQEQQKNENSGGKAKRRMPRKVLIPMGIGSIAVTLAMNVQADDYFGWTDGNPLHTVAKYTEALFRHSRTMRTVVPTAIRWTLADREATKRGLEGEELDKFWSEFHRAAAKRFLKLCMTQGGIYIKVGQHVSMAPIMPVEYTEELRPLVDQAPKYPWDDVIRTMQEEFNAHPDDLFKDMEHDPMASASLAQVHRGHTKDGTKVAIKVQHRKVGRYFRTDTLTLRFVYALMAKAIPGFDFQFLADEIEDFLVQELDFRTEASNCLRCEEIFKEHPNIRAPKIFKETSAERVLTMEFMEGTRIDRVGNLSEKGINPADVARALQEAFAKMTFLDGFLHCDPHPGNILIKETPEVDKNFTLVLLDHGLYKTLSPEFKEAYCKLWKSILLNDEKAMKACAVKLGADESAARFLQLVLTFAPPSIGAIDDNTKQMSKSAIFDEITNNGAAKISQILQALPREMILLIKTNNLLRHLNDELGAPINRFPIMARYARMGLKGTQSESSQSWLGAWLEDANLALRTYFHTYIMAFFLWRNS